MFKNISGILGQITPKQRIVALLMLLFTITLVLTGPQLIDSLRTPPTEYLELVEVQNEKIRELSSQVIKLNGEVVKQSSRCTDRIVERETEIAVMIRDLINTTSNIKYSRISSIDETARSEETIIVKDDILIRGLNDLYKDLTKK